MRVHYTALLLSLVCCSGKTRDQLSSSGGASSQNASGGKASANGGDMSSAATGGNNSSGAGASDAGAGGQQGDDDCRAVVDVSGNIEAPCVGMHGYWYLLADGFGPDGAAPGVCQSVGMHPDSECSLPAPLQFLAGGGDAATKVCTQGTVAAIGMLDGASDYNNQWGAALAFDFAATRDLRMTFDAAAAGVRGISFEIDQRPLAGLRVEFFDAATTGQEPAYWGAAPQYPISPVVVGVNEITWDEVVSPRSSIPDLDTTRLVSMAFHVPTSSAKSTYQFCISNVKLLR